MEVVKEDLYVNLSRNYIISTEIKLNGLCILFIPSSCQALIIF